MMDNKAKKKREKKECKPCPECSKKIQDVKSLCNSVKQKNRQTQGKPYCQDTPVFFLLLLFLFLIVMLQQVLNLRGEKGQGIFPD